MLVSLIVAYGQKRQIGKDNKLLWKIPEDLKLFKEITMGKTLIMGRKTFESIGRPLPGRRIIVLCRRPDLFQLVSESVFVMDSLQGAMEFAQEEGQKEIVIAGGGELYKEALSLCQRLYITEVDWDGDADTYFPEIDKDQWELVEKRDLTDKAHFKILSRKHTFC